MRLIAKDEWQQEVTEWVIANHEYTGKNPLNLRTQAKAFQTYQYAEVNGLDWRTEIEQELNANVSSIRGAIYELIGKGVVRTTELVKMLIRSGEVNNIRTAHNRVAEWLMIGELYAWSSEERNFLVGINAPEAMKKKEELVEVAAK